MATGTRGLIGKEDLSFHDPTTPGGATQTGTRATSTGVGTTSVTKLSAGHLPILDAAVVTNARTPWYGLDSGAGTSHYVENALTDARKNQYPVKNFSHYGAFEGTGITQGQADINRTVFAQIISDLSSSGGIIFFPPGTWLVDGTSGSNPILSVSSKSNITLCGVGFGSILRHYNASSGTDLLGFTDSSNITIRDMSLDAIRTDAGSCLSIAGSVGTGISQIRVLNISTANGLNGVTLDGGGGHGNGFWIENCYLSAGAASVQVTDFITGQVNRNILSLTAGSGGMTFTDGVTTNAVIGNLTISGNVLTGAGTQPISVARNNTYVSSDKDILISRNRISSGNIVVSGTDNTEMSFNELLAGGLSYTASGMTSARNFRALYNYSNSSTTNGIELIVTGMDLFDWEIVGGRYYGAQQHGVFVTTVTSGGVQNGRIFGVLALDNNASNSTNSGFRIACGAGTAIARTTMASCTAKAATGATTPTHQYGFHATNAGAAANNKFGNLIVNGYSTAPPGWLLDASWALPHVSGVDDVGT